MPRLHPLLVLGFLTASLACSSSPEDPGYSTEAPPTAQELHERALSSESIGQYSLANATFEQAASAGSVAAARHLADLYYSGSSGLAADHNQALVWFLRAAEGGDLDALYRAGRLHRDGTGGVPRDDRAGFELLSRAAEAGHADAQGDLGYMYFYGIHVAMDQSQAAEWFRRSSLQGNAYAQVRYGSALRFGWGVPVDEHEALRWIRSAAWLGDRDGQHSLAEMAMSGEGMEQDKPLAALMMWRKWRQGGEGTGESFRELDTELRSLAAADSGVGLRYLALAAAHGLEVPHDEEEAYRLYRLASEHGDVPALLEVARRLGTGLGVAEDDQAAADACRKAAELGSAEAQYEYGLLWERGSEQDDHATALEWFKLAAAQGHFEAERWLELEPRRQSALSGNAEAALDLGHAFALGIRLRRDFVHAESWFLKAADVTFTANQALAHLYLDGGTRVNLFGTEVFPRDDAKALQYLRVCADLGHTESRVEVARRLASGVGIAQDLDGAAHYAALAEVNGDASAVPYVAAKIREARTRRLDELLSSPAISDPIPPSPCFHCNGHGVLIHSLPEYIGGHYWPETYVTCEKCNGSGFDRPL